jgi:hypothetical protein
MFVDGVSSVGNLVSGGLSSLKGKFGWGSGTTPDFQATGTALPLESRSNAETDAKEKRVAAFNAATNARNKRAAANAATKNVDEMTAAGIKASGGQADANLNSPANKKLTELRKNATNLRNAAKAAEADAKIKEAKAVAAEAVVAEAKAATATAAADKGSMFNGITNVFNKSAESVKGGLTKGADFVKGFARTSMATTLPLTEENFKDQIKKMKEDFSKILEEFLSKYNMTTLDIDCLIKGGYVTISKYTWVSKREQYKHRDGSYRTNTEWVQEWSNFDTSNFYKVLNLEKFYDLQTKDITLKTFWTSLGEISQSELKLRMTLNKSKLEKIDIKTVCPPAQ